MTSTQEFNCILCKETFENKEDLQIHFRKHGDPEFNRSLKKSRPQSEAGTVTKKNEEVEMVSCDVCSEMFRTISKAITHKHKMHPDHDAKYFCPWCGKLFTMKHLYNKHLESNHTNSEQTDDSNFHCDVCDVDFFVPTAMLHHNKFFHRQDTDLPCIGQSKKLKMCPQNTLVQIYYCSFCGEEYDNKVNLHKHIGDDHSDENQSPEDVLRCPLCDAVFYHLDAYELHLTFHTTEDLYSETNEMFEQTTEFSLEAVSPIMEKVENVEPPEDVESEMNAVGLEKFLELAMGETVEKSEDNPKVKSKKHKKHKKSKKSAITLDEFLNMNKDVFGEGLDFQGIEEVPSQAIAKRLKKKPTMTTLKSLESSNLEKLKKQGIVVKVKTDKKPTMQRINMGNKVLKKIPASEYKPSLPVNATPDEVLSKLINQSNNQIKIVKKTTTRDKIDEPQQQDDSERLSKDKRVQSPENIEVECDVNMASGYTSSENEAKEEVKKGNESDQHPTSICAKLDDDDQKDDKSSHEKKETEAASEDDNVENNIIGKEDINTISSDTMTSQSLIKSISEKPTELPNSGFNELSDASESQTDAKDKTESDLEKKPKSPPDLNTTSSLDALKHLSHLITIKSVTPKKTSEPDSSVQPFVDKEETRIGESQEDSDIDEEDKILTPNHDKEVSLKSEQVSESNSSLNKLEHLKKLSTGITIKSLSHSPKNKDSDNDDDDETKHDILVKNKALPNVAITNKVTLMAKNVDANPPKSPANSPKIATSDEKEIFKTSNIDLLKHLTNVTAKPVISAKSNNQPKLRASSNVPGDVKNVVQNYMKKEETKEEIEIFNIDSSDDEPDKIDLPIVKATTNNTKSNISDNLPSKSMDTFKNISKNVSVRAINQQMTPLKTNSVQQNKHEEILNKAQRSVSEFSDEDDDDEQDTLVPTNFSSDKHKLTSQSDHIKNTLKNLGKHITVKSGLPSPNLSLKSGNDQDSKDMFDPNEEGDSDSDSHKGGVKITEITEDNEHDMEEQAIKYNENNPERSPENAFSDDDDNHFDEDDEGDLPDLEHEIKATTVKKPSLNITAQINLQNMNKNLTIKSLSDKNRPAPKEADTKMRPNLNSELSIKPFKQSKPEVRDGVESMVNKKLKNAAQVARTMSQNTASCSQQNTVNKEVTVKTFQTKTVIQEITTTVTKTIKTVNQTVKQELQSVQSTSQNSQVFQKVQGMKCSNPTKNFQGVTVRQAAPASVGKVKGPPTTINRPPIGATIRPSNQLVPVRAPNQAVPVRPSNQLVPFRPPNQLVPARPSMNTARMSRPRMTGPRKVTPSTSGTQQKPLRMSPHAMNTTKRPMDEPAGHFSCFKKPKESLIPVSDIPSFQNDQGDGSMVQYSASHMSKSNITSSTKTIKGNKVVTSTQMKSEISSSSQHLERLNSMSGLKVVKTNQMKQASKVEEKCESSEMSASKRNTLEAIEKLQKQGLLIKKPRLDDSNDSDHSDEDNSYITEEPDDD